MAIIRFLDKNKNSYQVSTPDQPMLIYLTPNERKMLSQAAESDCLFLISDKLDKEETADVIEKLNTSEPKVMN